MKQLIIIFTLLLSAHIFPCEYTPLVNQSGQPTQPVQKLLTLTDVDHNNTLPSIVQATQTPQSNGGWLREKNKERWQIEEIHKNIRAECILLFKHIGMTNSIEPTQKNYEYILLHGGPIHTIRLRLAYLVIECLNHKLLFNNLIVLTGQRLLDPVIENINSLYTSSKSILPFKHDWHPTKSFPKTEIEMIQLVLEQSILPVNWKNIKITYINAPGSIKNYRSTTADTIDYWLKNYHPKTARILAISNQPHIHYQHEILTNILPKQFQAETAGPSIRYDDIKLAIMFDALARRLYQKQKNILPMSAKL